MKPDTDIKKWEEKVIERKAMLYIKPTRQVHDSGFRCFEVGYCEMDKSGKRVKDKIVLSISDHIHTDFMGLIDFIKATTINMDLTLDGYIRIWGSSKSPVVWEDYPMSSAEIKNYFPK